VFVAPYERIDAVLCSLDVDEADVRRVDVLVVQ